MQYFVTKSDKPIEIFNIIKLLLLGTEDNINIAGMLFLVLKEKKTNNLIIANLIYVSLNFVSQIKLKMVNINVESEIKQLNELTFDDVDLRKQMSIVKNMPLYVKNLINEILIYDSNNIDALFFQGLNAFTEGNKKIATESWRKILSQLPKDSPMKLELLKKLKSIKD